MIVSAVPSVASGSGLSLMLTEGCFTVIAVALAFASPARTPKWAACIEQALGRLAHRRGLSVATVGVVALLLRLALLPVCPIPQPFIPDDFSFLLSGDTFASGRLANPTPVMWTHFETIHVSMQPTYMSMYFPAQGLVLAAGKVLFGHPWFGLLCVNALLCAAICWALQAWLPPRWALLGGFLAILRLSLFSYWINTYTGGGAIAALGGALVLGAFPRVMRSVRLRDALLLALGIVVLLLSRPYEGLLLCLPVAVVLGHWILFGRNRPAPAILFRRAALPLAVIVAGGAWLAYYDYRAFGSPTTLPYTINRATYAVAPYWIWQSPRPEPAYRHPVMRDFYVTQELTVVTKFRTAYGFFQQNLVKPLSALRFFAGFALLPPLIMLRRVLLDRRTRFFILSGLFWCVGIFLQIVMLPHYLAPFTVAFYTLGLQCMRHLRVWKPEKRPVGIWMVRFLGLTCIAMAALRTAAEPLHFQLANWPPSEWTANWIGPSQLGAQRARIEESLSKLQGKQLVIVRYASDHDPVWEWVYNAPNIDSAKVIWAREMDTASNLELIRYYKDRNVWLVEPDKEPTDVSAYTSPEQTSSNSTFINTGEYLSELGIANSDHGDR